MPELLAARISESVAAIVTACELENRRSLARLSESLRRIRHAPDGIAWKRAILDAVAPFTNGASVMHISECSGARAVVSAVESQETVVAATVEGEFPPEVLQGMSGCSKAYVFPLGATKGVLIVPASANGGDASVLQMIADIAAISLPVAQTKRNELVGIAPNRSDAEASQRLESSVHLEAQRFARVRVAEILLHYGAALKAGRRSSRLYQNLQMPLDRARTDFQDRFASSPGMVDYLHGEVVSQLAQNRAELLGWEYPGPIC